MTELKNLSENEREYVKSLQFDRKLTRNVLSRHTSPIFRLHAIGITDEEIMQTEDEDNLILRLEKVNTIWDVKTKSRRYRLRNSIRMYRSYLRARNTASLPLPPQSCAGSSSVSHSCRSAEPIRAVGIGWNVQDSGIEKCRCREKRR